MVLLAGGPAASAAFQHAWTGVLPQAASGDRCGTAVAFVGESVVAGAPYRDVATVPDAGAVVAFDGRSGSVRGVFTAPAPQAGARFGSALAALGGSVLVGAPHEDSGRPHAGAVYRVGLGTGEGLERVPNPEPGFDDLFGAALAAAGPWWVVGTPLDGAEPPAGAVWLRGAGGAWRRLVKPVPVAYELFGAVVAATDRLVLVGAPTDGAVQPNGGAVYVLDAVSGQVVRTLLPLTPARGDEFGRALAVAGSLVLVGAPRDDVETATDAGSVYLFDLDSGALLRRCTAPVPENGAAFGSAVAFAGAELVVGAPLEDAGALNAGAVHVLDIACTPRVRLDNPTPHRDDQFGHAVAGTREGDAIAVGAWHDDPDGTRAGAGTVHLFVTAPGATVTTTTTIGGMSSTTGAASTTTATAVTTTTVHNAPPGSLPIGATTTTSSLATGSTLPLTSTTTSGLGGTSTTMPPGSDLCSLGECEACRFAGCAMAACAFAPPGPWAVLGCRLEELRGALEVHGSSTLGPGPRLRAGRLLHRVALHVERALAHELPGRRRRLLRRATRTLAVLRRLVERRTLRPAKALRPGADGLLRSARAAERALAGVGAE